MKNDAVLLSHWDLDGAGCSVLSSHIWDIQCYKHQGYGKIRKSLDYLVAKYSRHVDTIVIADLKIEKYDLKHALENFQNVIYYDHHESSAEFSNWVEMYPNFEFHFDLKRCSTALMWVDGIQNKNAENTSELNTFMQTVNVYDMWKQNSPRWNDALLLNDLFWHLAMNDFRKRFYDGLSHFTPTELLFGEQQKQARNDAVKNATIEKIDNGSTIVVMQNPNAINSVSTLLDGDIFYIITLDWSPCNVSIRVKDSNTKFNINNGIKTLQDEFPNFVQSAGGHISAGGITFCAKHTVNDIVDFLYENDYTIRDRATIS